MASVTRSSRRAEALLPHQHPHPHSHSHHLTTPSTPAIFHQSAGRNKRVLDVADHDFDAIKPKRTRISVEILAKGSGVASDAVRVPSARPRPPVATVSQNPPTPKPPTTAAPQPQPQPQPRPQPQLHTQLPPPKPEPILTKHQAKVINGIRHELNRLQPSVRDKDTKEQGGRKLRSQEATRFKSELSAYFPDYDEVIGNDPKEQHLLNLDTPIAVVDSGPRRAVAFAQRDALLPHRTDDYPIRGYGDSLFYDIVDAQSISFDFLEAQYKNKTPEDPLPNKLFQPAHKRAERLERSIRNTEKGRAQHEKDQIIRLLEGLQGHDWLRVMGVSGITETKKKTFEPARDHFIRGCQAIIDKFRNWSQEERRRKREKEKALAEQADEEEEEEDEKEKESAEEEGKDVDEDEDEDDRPSQDRSCGSASPAKQLQEEAMARSKPSAKGGKNRRSTPQPRVQKLPKPPRPPEPPREFTSFFIKKYERDSALNRHRRAGRKVMAWGHPIPEIPQQDFELPEEYRDDDTLKARARKKRRDKRGSKH